MPDWGWLGWYSLHAHHGLGLPHDKSPKALNDLEIFLFPYSHRRVFDIHLSM